MNRPDAAPRSPRTTLAAVCGAHALHDGYTDLLYLLLPLWRTEFALSYAAIGLLRALYAGVLAAFQLPAGLLARRVPGGAASLLVLGTVLAAAGYLVAGASVGFTALAAALVVGGLGSSVQHPLGSSLVADAYEGRRSRSALGTYNFSGDLGKMTLPAATAALLSLMPWRRAVGLLGLLGLATAAAVWWALRRRGAVGGTSEASDVASAGEGGQPGGHPPRRQPWAGNAGASNCCWPLA